MIAQYEKFVFPRKPRDAQFEENFCSRAKRVLPRQTAAPSLHSMIVVEDTNQ